MEYTDYLGHITCSLIDDTVRLGEPTPDFKASKPGQIALLGSAIWVILDVAQCLPYGSEDGTRRLARNGFKVREDDVEIIVCSLRQ